MKRKGCSHQSHSSRSVDLARLPSHLSHSALITVASPDPASEWHFVQNGKPEGPNFGAYPPFAVQLPGPFTLCAAVPLPPVRDSLELALSATLPVHSHCSSVVAIEYILTGTNCQFSAAVVSHLATKGSPVTCITATRRLNAANWSDPGPGKCPNGRERRSGISSSNLGALG